MTYISAVGLTLSKETKHNLMTLFVSAPLHFDLDAIFVPLAYFQGQPKFDIPSVPGPAIVKGFATPYSSLQEHSDLILDLASPELVQLRDYFVAATNGIASIYTPEQKLPFALFSSPVPPLSRVNRGWIANMSTTLVTHLHQVTFGEYVIQRIL